MSQWKGMRKPHAIPCNQKLLKGSYSLPGKKMSTLLPMETCLKHVDSIEQLSKHGFRVTVKICVIIGYF